MKRFRPPSRIPRRAAGGLRPALLGLLLACLAACSPAPVPVDPQVDFRTSSFQTEIPYATPEVIRLHEANLSQEYRIGPGDVIQIDVWNRDKLTGEHVVGPYGNITLPMLGDFQIGDLNTTTSAERITALYRRYYVDPIVTVKILKYLNNKVYVLGRVTNPGVVHFAGGGTLLEALSLAGGLPSRDKTIFLSKCYIVRGKDQIIWVDLLQLLQKADMRLNMRLANNDIIYIPESTDAAVFVMGEIKRPGSYQIQTAGLSLLDALNMAEGPTENANIANIYLVRNMQESKGVKIIDLNEILKKGDFSQNYLLKDNDIIYLPRKGIATFNYYLRQIDPLLRTFISATIIQQAVDN